MPAKNVTTKATIQNLTAELKATFAKKSHLPTRVSQLTNDNNYQTGAQVETSINAKLGSVYKPGPSVAFANLPALTAANEGFVYNITDAFTTTADFVEGAGKKHKAGADVGIVNAGTAETPVYKYNVFANFTDLSGYMEKISGGTSNALVKQDANGQVIDTGIDASDVVTKVSGATAGNFAGLDANGKLIDSGKKAADFVERTYNQDETEDVVLRASDISDYTAAEIAALLADDEVQGGNGEE